MPQLVVHRARAGLALCQSQQELTRLLALMEQETRRRQLAVHAYHLRPEGFSMLLRATDAGALSSALRVIARLHSLHLRQGQTGSCRSLWDGRFRSAVVAPGPMVLRVMTYLDRDAGARSSAGHHLGLERERWLVDPQEYWKLGNMPFERQEAYRRLLDAPGDVDGDRQIEAAVRGGWLLHDGSTELTGIQANRAPAPNPRGRPRKARSPASTVPN